MLLVASCYRNRDKLRPNGPLGSYADFTISTINGTYCSQIGHLGLLCSEFLSVNTLFQNWSLRTVFFRVPICK